MGYGKGDGRLIAGYDAQGVRRRNAIDRHRHVRAKGPSIFKGVNELKGIGAITGLPTGGDLGVQRNGRSASDHIRSGVHGG